jgi:hypothetical protein
MVKPTCLSKRAQHSIKVYNNIILQSQYINTKHKIQEQQKVNNPFSDNKNTQKINVNK